MSRHVLIGLALVAVLFVCALPAEAGLSGNLVSGGDFEDTSYLKTDDSPDGVLIHRFSQANDVGLWLAKWGPPSQGGLAGFSLYDDPRDLNETGGDTQSTGDLGSVNRSVDPLNPGNHILEPVLFRPRWGQWIEAPANHVPGPMSFSFDMLVKEWDTINMNNGRVWLYGSNSLPTNDESYCEDVSGALVPSGADMLVQFRYSQGRGLSNPGYLDVWQDVSTDAPSTLLWGDLNNPANTNILTTELTQTYAYYAVIVYAVVYPEDHPYFWLNGGKITDTFAQGFDNFDLRVSVGVPGDFNGDGQVTLSDINPFKLALTDVAAWQAQYPDVILAGVDPNGDGVVTLSDINPFKQLLTGGQGAVIPEPGAATILAACVMWAVCRRR
ncbi:MAG: hypothetical protein IT443_02665 [Phycisphaeraceae bacterium]|nr:hypothetical protein [Phycisphaeraceae bacterium]